MRGTWGVTGTDPDQVEKMVRDVTGLLAGEGAPRGIGGWLGLAGRLLGGALAGTAAGAADGGHQEGEEQEDQRRGGSVERSVRGSEPNRIGYGGSGSEVSRDGRGKGRRSIDDQGYHDDGSVNDEDDIRNDMRRRRRRRRRDVD